MGHVLWPDKVLGYSNFSVGLARCLEVKKFGHAVFELGCLMIQLNSSPVCRRDSHRNVRKDSERTTVVIRYLY
jgi:hypothetical protein